MLALCLDFERSVAALLHMIGSYRHSRNGIQVAKELGGDAYKILVRKPKVVLFYCFVLYFIKLKIAMHSHVMWEMSSQTVQNIACGKLFCTVWYALPLLTSRGKFFMFFFLCVT